MNILFVSLLYHPDDLSEVNALSSVGLQNQANGFQWAMIEGIQKNLCPGETISTLNALPVGTYPRQYRKLWLHSKSYGKQFTEIGSINLPFCKQKQRQWSARWRIERWIEQSEKNRMLVLYSLYLPYLRAIAAVKERYSDLKTCIIVTDLPGGLGLASGRQGLLKKIEYKMGAESMRLASLMNGFILLTEQMAEPLHIQTKKRCIIEGLTAEYNVVPEAIKLLPQDERPAVLYTGTLNRELGMGDLLQAFERLDAYQLWICGNGDMADAIREAQKKHDNITYFGFVSQAQAIYLQSKAAVLINPRTNQGVYTRYSFPSKTMEYMRSGKPVLCCKLDGIPQEYNDYLTYYEPQNEIGIRIAIESMMQKPQKERDDIGRRAREFVLSKKNNIAQGERAVDLLRLL